LALALGVVAGCAALAPTASAEERAIELLSGSGAASPATFTGASADGTRVFFFTQENLPGDTDGLFDIYQALGGTPTLLTGSNASGSHSGSMSGSSSDGTRIFFTTDENIPGTGDTDLFTDIFQVQGGLITLLSGNNPVATGGDYAFYVGASSDGTRVFFKTVENIPGTTDTDNQEDLYQAQGGAITLLTGNNAAGTFALFDDSSSDGSKVFFETQEAIPGKGDLDSQYDIYKAEGSAITLMTPGTADAPNFVGISSDGSRLFFESDENLAAPDVDNLEDTYQAQGGVISLLSGNNPSGSGGEDAAFAENSSDGTRVFFETEENIPGSGDTDLLTDIYQVQGGVITLLTGSNPAGSGGDHASDGSGVSSDGTRLFFTTNENIPGTGDTDGLQDVYRAQGGAITLLSGSNPTGSGGAFAFSVGHSSDGTRAFINTTENVPGSGDTDSLSDVYESQGGAPTLLSGSNPAGSGGVATGLIGASTDGARAFFQTTESIPGTGDGDGAQDVYQSRVLPPTAATTPPVVGPTGLRAAALKKCRKKKTSSARSKCKKKAKKLPL
jgi:hypothetical protein